MGKVSFCASTVLAWLVLAGEGVSATVDLAILSGGDWLSTDTSEEGWQDVDFDDSAWSDARGSYPNPVRPDEIIPGTSATLMWHDPGGRSRGDTGPLNAFFRYSFDLMPAIGAPLLGQGRMWVDDDYELFLNGSLLSESKDDSRLSVDFFDFTELLQSGKNVFAIHAVDGAWSDPDDLLYEAVLFDAKVAPIPVPATLPLLGVSLLVLGLLRHQRRRKHP